MSALISEVQEQMSRAADPAVDASASVRRMINGFDGLAAVAFEPPDSRAEAEAGISEIHGVLADMSTQNGARLMSRIIAEVPDLFPDYDRARQAADRTLRAHAAALGILLGRAVPVSDRSAGESLLLEDLGPDAHPAIVAARLAPFDDEPLSSDDLEALADAGATISFEDVLARYGIVG